MDSDNGNKGIGSKRFVAWRIAQCLRGEKFVPFAIVRNCTICLSRMESRIYNPWDALRKDYDPAKKSIVVNKSFLAI
jgi:hypothetical protein